MCPWIPLSVVDAVDLPVPEACWYPTGKATYKRLGVQSADGHLYSLDYALRCYLVERQTVTLLPPVEADEELAAGCRRSTGRRLASSHPYRLRQRAVQGLLVLQVHMAGKSCLRPGTHDKFAVLTVNVCRCWRWPRS